MRSVNLTHNNLGTGCIAQYVWEFYILVILVQYSYLIKIILVIINGSTKLNVRIFFIAKVVFLRLFVRRLPTHNHVMSAGW